MRRAARSAALPGGAADRLEELRRRAAASRGGASAYFDDGDDERAGGAGASAGGPRGGMGSAYARPGDDDDDDDDDDPVRVEYKPRDVISALVAVCLARAVASRGPTLSTLLCFWPLPQAPAAEPVVQLSEEEQMRLHFPAAFGQTAKKAAGPDLKAVLAQTRREAAADEAPAVGPARPPMGGGGGSSDDEDDDGGRGGAGAEDRALDPYNLPVSHEAVLSGHTRLVSALDVEHTGSRMVTGGCVRLRHARGSIARAQPDARLRLLQLRLWRAAV